MKSTQLFTITIAAALVLLSGVYFSAPAGQRANRTIPRGAVVTTVPAPVVDDTPINPDTSAKIKPRDNPNNNVPVKQPPRRRTLRR
jgi:hypothetical protein